MKNLLLASLLASASVAALAQVEVSGAWIRATVPSSKATGLFMRITAKQAAQLTAVRSPLAGAAEIHQMVMDGQMMRMHTVPSVALPAGQALDMAAGGYHIMLLDLKRQLKAGDTVPVTLVLRQAGKPEQTVSLDVEVKPLTYAPGR